MWTEVGKPSVHCVGGEWLIEVAGATGENQLVLWLVHWGPAHLLGEGGQIPDPEKQEQAAQFGEDGGRTGNLWDSQGLDPSSI